MKKLILITVGTLALLQSTAFAKNNVQLSSKKQEITCKKLYSQAKNNCIDAMCESYYEQSGDTDCAVAQQDGDFYEGLGECIGEDFPELIISYNNSHPKNKLTCENY